MALRKIFKQFASICARCSNSQQKHVLCRTLWVATARKDATKDAGRPCLKMRFNSTDSKEAVVRSSRPHVDLPKVSLSDYMFSRFSKFGSKTALHDFETGTTYRYDELEDLVRRVGSFLVRRGFEKGDVIAYWGTNNPEFALLMLGCASVGVILTTANPMYTEGEISRHMEHSGAKAIFTIPSLVHKVQEAGVWLCLSYETK